MISEIFNDIFNSVGYIFQGSSLVVLLPIIAISIFAGLRMQKVTAIFGWLFEATILLGLFVYLWNWLTAPGWLSLGVWEAQTIESWNAVMRMSLQELIGYFAVFFLLIMLIFVVKRFARG
ncbi:MAG: hypothetical protein MRY59_05345 [Aquisalinus sp.]|nr:hypothetical protein [Aquisalinus sp.]